MRSKTLIWNYLSIQSLPLKFCLSSGVFQFELLFLNLILKLSDVKLLKLIVTKLWSFKWLDLVHGFVLVLVLQLRNFDLFHILNIDELIM